MSKYQPDSPRPIRPSTARLPPSRCVYATPSPLGRPPSRGTYRFGAPIAMPLPPGPASRRPRHLRAPIAMPLPPRGPRRDARAACALPLRCLYPLGTAIAMPLQPGRPHHAAPTTWAPPSWCGYTNHYATSDLTKALSVRALAQRNWRDTEKVSAAPGQGQHAQNRVL